MATKKASKKAVSKAEQVRSIIKANPRKGADALLDPVMKKTGLGKSLARVYLVNNMEKIKKVPSKKKAAKKSK